MTPASLPAGWRRERIENLAAVSRGASPRPIASPRWFSDESDVGWVRIADIGRSDGLMLKSTTQRLSPAGVARSKLLPPGTLIMSIAATVGLPIVTAIPACIHDGFVALQHLRGVDRTFLFYALKSLEPELRSAGQTGSQANVNTRIVKELKISLPPVAEQLRIAEALLDVDLEIAALRRLIEKKEEIRLGLSQRLLSGRSRLPGFGGSWRRMAVDELVSPVKERVDPQSVPPGTPLVELEDILPGRGRLRPAALSREVTSMKSSFQPGDVLFGRLRAYLRKYLLAETTGVCSTEIWVLRPTDATIGVYVRYLVESKRFIDAASGSYGTHMPRSDWSYLRKTEFEVPPVEEQRAIASTLQAADGEIDLLWDRVAKARAVREGMMQELLTGRTRLPAEDAVAA
jgi:type I restriction enzyme S subunit